MNGLILDRNGGGPFPNAYPASEPERAEGKMPSIKILIVEDNVLTRKMVRAVLLSEGYEVLEAKDGQTALALTAAHAPHLILQDLMLPDMDAAHLLRQLRALPGCAAIPILACSTLYAQREESRAIEIGFDGYLPKPVSPSRLLGVLRLHLSCGPANQQT